MEPRTRSARRIGVIALFGVLGLVLPIAAQAAPEPPDNPTDAEIQAGREAARESAGKVGELANRLAEADERLVALQAQVERKMEEANKARVDLRRAEDAHARALSMARAARGEANAAGDRIEAQRKRLDEFAASSYRQGSRVGSATAYIGSKSPGELLERASLLDAISDSQLDVMDDLQRARIEKVNKDSLARAALEEAEAKKKAADEARAAAEAAQRAAIEARSGQVAESRRLEARKAEVEDRLEAARSRVSGLREQRAEYEDWRAAKRRAEQQAAAAAAAAQSNESGGGDPAPTAGSSAVETVVQRALSQLGEPYAWGGGNASGPTRGIRDGGVADSYGDYAKIGFDCSGLMIYAFAGVGISLDHYSGYQAQSGTRVPLSQKQRGDMLFWRDGGGIHHVAMYLGNGKMVEAPYSGSHVRVTSVRYSGIAPYAVRLL
ncbi:NlpC/P60 family protein [Saccharopolyspora halophila]|uniref:NlpC/P60 family protein n=1 Tax=Saccharopolyspora halophila TaxID=405551 RepID=A0ABN3GIX6_9PSEU